MHLDIPAITIRTMPNGNVRLNGSELGSVELHRWHIRLLAEELGLVSSSASATAREIESLRQQLINARVRAEELEAYVAELSDWHHADLSIEMAKINGLVDMLTAACLPLEGEA